MTLGKSLIHSHWNPKVLEVCLQINFSATNLIRLQQNHVDEGNEDRWCTMFTVCCIKRLSTSIVDPLVKYQNAKVTKQTNQEDQVRDELKNNTRYIPEKPVNDMNRLQNRLSINTASLSLIFGLSLGIV